MGRGTSTGFLAILMAIAIVMNSITPAAAHKGLKIGFYRKSCPEVETIVHQSMVQSYNTNKTVAPGVLRLAFHDCFVRGCDASVLLDGLNSERKSILNSGLHGFDAVDAAKRAVEKACPGIVSAADVLQFAARDSVVLTGGYRWSVPAGRRDGTVSLITEATDANLPTPNMTISTLVARFQGKGLSASQMVVLSASHTIGRAPCTTFDDRIQTNPVDPALDPSFAKSLKKKCPRPQILSTRVALDSTPGRFDTQYFKDIIRGRGLLSSDQGLLYDSRTKGDVHANKGTAFFRNFGNAMVAMSQIGVLTDGSGEIRRQIDQVNQQ